MSIPLINEVNKNDINTSIIAIKKNIERINILLGLNNTEEIDTSEFVKKSDIVYVEAPIGSLISMYKKSSPSGYLYCDGSTFDQTKYPALYQYLGSNVLPDYRECVAVGAEQNTTDTIASHDVYTEGQFKDDQLQNHEHGLTLIGINDSASALKGVGNYSTTNGHTSPAQSVIGGAYGDIRFGTTTHGKQKAVFIYIKATSGLTENQQENVLNTINENLSYSTTEHNTGKKWIDGKPIYSKTFYSDTGWTDGVLVGTIADFDKIISTSCVSHDSNNNFANNFSNPPSNEVFAVYVNKTQGTIYTVVNNIQMVEGYITLECTKTTDN
jgi:microcystin-dependent protein